MSRKSLEPRTGRNITEAAERASMLIRGLQSRLTDQPQEESAESLEWELQKCFEAQAGTDVSSRFPLSQIRQKVTEGVATKILAGWDLSTDNPTPIENEVVELLIERVFERLIAARGGARDGRHGTLNSSNGSAKLPPTQISA